MSDTPVVWKDDCITELVKEARHLRAMLWAAAQSGPLRISRVAIDDYGPDSALRLTDDLPTGDILVFAEKVAEKV